jgi:tetratricopeptide (TPR) repeat protein
MLALALDVSLRALAAAFAIAIVLRLLRVRSASLRHAAWSAVLIVMLAMPVLTTIVPSVTVSVPSAMTVDFPRVSRLEPALGIQTSEVLADVRPASAETAAPATSPVTRTAPAPPDRRSDAAPSKGPYVALAIYALGVLFVGGRLTAGWMMARRLLRSAHVTALRATVPVLESPAVATPLTFGIVRSVIVLPVEWRRWREVKLRAVLAHEEAHITRRDGLMAFLAHMNRAVFWFHPLAWWLPRTLAAHAEHACDDAAAGAVTGRREYAEVLVEIAESVSTNGRRVAWQAIGVEGTGLLGTRIERLVRGNIERASRARVVVTTVVCTIALASAVACRKEPPPLQADPELAKQYEEQAERTAEFRAAINMTLDQVDALEARVAADPIDWEAREQLVTYYNAAKDVPWERKVPGLRRHALWLIEHHPEHEVAAPPLSPEYDPDGFAQAVRLWDAHLHEPDASPHLVWRAARFFAPYDKPRAEQLLLRGMAMDPKSEALRPHMDARLGLYEWHNQLGSLYARAILGSVDHFPTRRFDPNGAVSSYARDVRQKLTKSTDARLLARVGSEIVMARHKGEPVAAIRALGRDYLQRALAIDPTRESARTMLTRSDKAERHERIWHAVTQGGDVAAEDRLAYLANKASWKYMLLEGAESWRKDPDLAKTSKPEAKAAAEEVLKLAAEHRDSPDYAVAVMTAHHTLGLLALHSGDRDAAVHHMLESVKVPDIVSAEGVVEAVFVAQRLPTYLLKEGERETVIEYYEAAARISPRERERLLEDARAVREGRMPRSYQSMFAHPIFTIQPSPSAAVQR